MSTTKAPILFYTFGASPNGQQIAILLEELKAAYPNNADIEWEKRIVDLKADEQKEDWYIKLNPNGRIPTITHRKPDGSEFNVMETGAILLYLADLYDVDKKLSFESVEDQSVALQWIFFAHGGVGPMLGQASHFTYASEKIPYAINRYTNETKRLFGVMEIRLSEGGGREYLAGSGKGKYSIADVKAWPWVKGYVWLNITKEEFAKDYPHLDAWFERIAARPAVQKGLPTPA